jgi:endonuclease/exonuclease/phosphatase family metal-dependent hydrolase
MTFNIRHAEGLDGHVDIRRIIAELQKARPDVIALQEVDRFQWRSGWQDQVRIISSALNMNYQFSPSIVKGFSQYGNALLSRYPLLDPQVIPLPGIKEKRSVLTAKLNVNGTPVTVMVTHLGVTLKDRQMQMPRLMDVIRAVHGPKIIMGDFNMPEDHPLMASLKAAVSKIHLQTPEPTVIHGREIDHIFSDLPASEPARIQITHASDHTPVLIDISFSTFSFSLFL